MQNSWNCVCRVNCDNGSVATSGLQMTEEDVEVCAVICAVGLLYDWKCNMNRKQFKDNSHILTTTVRRIISFLKCHDVQVHLKHFRTAADALNL